MPALTLTRSLAAGLGGAVTVAVVTAWVLVPVAGWSWSEAVDTFVVTNGLIALTFGLCGAAVAWHRPGNPIGWLFVAQGVCHGTTAVLAPVIQLVRYDGAAGGLRLLITLAEWAWPWSISLCLPLALLLFPDGRLPSPRWRAVFWLTVLTAPLFAVEMAAGPGSLGEPGLPPGYLKLPGYDALGPLWTATEVRNLVCLALACVALVLRYRAGDPTTRGQLRWLFLAAVIAVGFIVPWAFIAGTPTLVLLAIPLIPVAVALSIVRHRLWDLRLAVSRAVVWAMFRQVGERLPHGLPAIPEALAEALRLPYVAVVASGVPQAAYGEPCVSVERVPLLVGADQVGELVVGLRDGERKLPRAVRAAIELVASPLALAVQSMQLSADLATSRERLVTAREEERRRIRRDLHDGLGPTLTGLAITADAAANRQSADGSDPAIAELLSRIRTESRLAIASVRQIVEDLRPPALDQLGLVGALRQRTDLLSREERPIRLLADGEVAFSPLPAAVEVAAYRVALEGLTNAIRHADGGGVTLRLARPCGFEVEILDAGRGTTQWPPGVGLTSMRQRTEELGGSFHAGPTPAGGRVLATFPLRDAPDD